MNPVARARHFLVDRRGNFAVIFAVCIVPIIALAGAAIDYSRIRAAEDKLQDAADAAALAAATSGGPVSRMQNLAEDFVLANASDYEATVQTTVNQHDLKVEVSTVLALPVLSALGKPEMVISVVSRVESLTPLKGGTVGYDQTGSARKIAELRRKLARLTRNLPYYQRQQIARQVEAAIRASSASPDQVRLSR